MRWLDDITDLSEEAPGVGDKAWWAAAHGVTKTQT